MAKICTRKSGDDISNIFVKVKRDNTLKMIILLIIIIIIIKRAIHTVIDTTRPNYFMTSVDLIV